MQFTAADQGAMLAALGEDAVVATGSIRVLFEAPGEMLDGVGGLITTNPTALAEVAAIAAHGLFGGENGSAIAIDSVDYVILGIIPDGDGFATMTLELV